MVYYSISCTKRKQEKHMYMSIRWDLIEGIKCNFETEIGKKETRNLHVYGVPALID
jgi:hypothetical protein